MTEDAKKPSEEKKKQTAGDLFQDDLEKVTGGAEAQTQKVELSDFTITKNIDKSSP